MEGFMTHILKKLAVRGFIAALSISTCSFAQQPGSPNEAAQVPMVTRSASGSDASLTMLSDLIEQRLALMEEVSKAKWNTGSAIEDPEREQKVLQDVEAKAKQADLPPQWVQHFFRLQIEAAKLVQYQLFSQWRKSNQNNFSKTMDLNSQIRPQLDQITVAILAALKSNWPTVKAKPIRSIEPAVFGKSRRFPQAERLAFTPLFDGSAQSGR
jgi:chorismate mutase-like protein